MFDQQRSSYSIYYRYGTVQCSKRGMKSTPVHCRALIDPTISTSGTVKEIPPLESQGREVKKTKHHHHHLCKKKEKKAESSEEDTVR